MVDDALAAPLLVAVALVVSAPDAVLERAAVGEPVGVGEGVPEPDKEPLVLPVGVNDAV